jgi:hypothetical protein
MIIYMSEHVLLIFFGSKSPVSNNHTRVNITPLESGPALLLH